MLTHARGGFAHTPAGAGCHPARAGLQRNDTKVQALMDMGFDRETVVQHLEKCNYDQNTALESILSSTS